MAYIDDLYIEKKKCEEFINNARLVANKLSEAANYLGNINAIHLAAYSINEVRADDNYIQRLYQSEKKIISNITANFIPTAQTKIEELKQKIITEEEAIRQAQAKKVEVKNVKNKN